MPARQPAAGVKHLPDKREGYSVACCCHRKLGGMHSKPCTLRGYKDTCGMLWCTGPGDAQKAASDALVCYEL